MKILYYDCFAGISGDMNMGALIDLGVDKKYLLSELGKLRFAHVDIKIRREKRKGIAGTRFIVRDLERKRTKIQKDRTYNDIVKIIEKSRIKKAVQEKSIGILTTLAKAEAKVHGVKLNDVHFHEIGAVDSIVDIVGAAIGLDYIAADKIISSSVQVGGGFVKCAHGILPVPAPAVAEILKNIPVKSGAVPVEMTTPTGAAILSSSVDEFTDVFDFTPLNVGYGIGTRDTEIPNVLRIFLGETHDDLKSSSDPETGRAVMVECNIDDMNPEMYDFIMDKLFVAGAHDVFLTPIIMKKSRPAVIVSVLCSPEAQKRMEDTLWRHSSSFGLRAYGVSKKMLKRETVKVRTPYGEVSVKKGYLRGREIKSKPEYEDCKRLAKKTGVSIREIYDSLRKRKG